MQEELQRAICWKRETGLYRHGRTRRTHILSDDGNKLFELEMSGLTLCLSFPLPLGGLLGHHRPYHGYIDPLWLCAKFSTIKCIYYLISITSSWKIQYITAINVPAKINIKLSPFINMGYWLRWKKCWTILGNLCRWMKSKLLVITCQIKMDCSPYVLSGGELSIGKWM